MKSVKEIIIVLVVLAVFKTIPSDAQNLPASFNFVKDLQTAYGIAKSQFKPIMLIIHLSGCPACIALRPKLGNSKVVTTMSKSFIMVSDEDKKDKVAEAIKLDGGYYPRIYFFGCDGTIFKNITNPNQSKYKYYYTDEYQVADAMRKSIEANKKITG